MRKSRFTEEQIGESIYDPACGTGSMLLEAVPHVRESHGDDRTLWGKLLGQEKNGILVFRQRGRIATRPDPGSGPCS